MLIKMRKSQTVTEYSIMFSAIVAGLIGLQIYFQRSVKGNLKQRSDSVGGQFTTTQDYTTEETSQTLRSSEGGYVAADGRKYWARSETLGATGESGIDGIESGWIDNIPGKKLESYAGVGYSRTDYVTAEEGSGEVGDHGTFDSGVLATTTPWEDSGIESTEGE